MDMVNGLWIWTLSTQETNREADETVSSLIDRGVPKENVAWYLCSPNADHIRSFEVLADVYGFREYLLSPKDKVKRRLFPGLLFDRQKIGERRYNAATVATSKAMRSLWAKNLAMYSDKVQIDKSSSRYSGHSCLTLTSEGVAKADEIKAKMPSVLQDLSLYCLPDHG